MDEYPTTRRRPIQITIGFLLALTASCGWMTCVARMVTRRIEGQGASATVANEAFGQTACVLRLPDQSHNVDFEAYFQSGNAAFDIAEAEFLMWAREYPWKLSEINLSGKVPASWELHDHLDGWPEDVCRVWYFSNSSHRGGWTVMYDRDRRRAYVIFAPR